MGKDCSEMVRNYKTKDEFLAGMDALDKKYPGIGFGKERSALANSWKHEEPENERNPFFDDDDGGPF